MRIALVRHPRPQVARGICYGRLDIALHPEGRASIASLVEAVASLGIRAVWTSPARRCRPVADAIAAAHGVAPCADPRLQELDFGAWEGMAWNNIPRADLDRWAENPLDVAPPGGEHGAGLLARVKSFHADLGRASGDCAVVAHGGPLKLLGALLRGEDPDLLSAAPEIGSVQILAA